MQLAPVSWCVECWLTVEHRHGGETKMIGNILVGLVA